MSKYRKILFQHLDGIVCIPTILAFHKTDIFNFIITTNNIYNLKFFYYNK